MQNVVVHLSLADYFGIVLPLWALVLVTALRR